MKIETIQDKINCKAEQEARKAITKLFTGFTNEIVSLCEKWPSDITIECFTTDYKVKSRTRTDTFLEELKEQLLPLAISVAQSKASEEFIQKVEELNNLTLNE